MDGIVTSSSGNPGTFSNSFDVNGNANTSANASKYLTNTPYAEFMPTIEYARISQLGILNAPRSSFYRIHVQRIWKNYISGNDTERFQIRCIRVKNNQPAFRSTIKIIIIDICLFVKLLICYSR